MDLDPIRLDFVPTPRLRRLAMVAGLAVALAVVTSHGELLVVAVVPLVLLVGVPRSAVPAAGRGVGRPVDHPLRRGRRGRAGADRRGPTGATGSRPSRWRRPGPS